MKDKIQYIKLIVIMIQLMVLNIQAMKPNQNANHSNINTTTHFDTTHYQVAKIDSIKGSIQRLFIVIDSAEVHNYEVIQEIVNEVCANYNLDNKSRLSFFCDEKYADYMDNLFLGNQTEFTVDDYYKWMDHYYLGEFDFSTKVYMSYPGFRGKGVKGRKKTLARCA